MRVRVGLIVVSVALVGFAPAPFPRPERHRQGLTDVNGIWVFERCETNGVDNEQARLDYRMEVTARQFVFASKGQRAIYQMRLDPTASPPLFTWGSDSQVMFVGSYRLRRDELTMIFSGEADVTRRPRDFDGKPPWRYVMRRVSRD